MEEHHIRTEAYKEPGVTWPEFFQALLDGALACMVEQHVHNIARLTDARFEFDELDEKGQLILSMMLKEENNLGRN